MQGNAGKLLVLALALFGLAGCVPVGYYDPYAVRSGADAAIQATEAARGEIVRQATIEAGRNFDAATATVAMWQFQASQTAVAATATQSAFDFQASQTAAAATAVEQQRVATETARVEQAAAATATQIAEVKRQRDENAALISYYAGMAWRVLLPFGAAFLFVTLLVIVWRNRDAVRKFIQAKEMQARLVDRGPNKDPMITFLLPDGRTVIVDMPRLPGSAAVIGDNGMEVQGLGRLPDLAGQVIARAQMVDLVRAWPVSERGAAGKMISTALGDKAPVAAPAVVNVAGRDLPESAPWSALDAWKGPALPLGMGAQGMIMADPEHSPHFLFAGTTDSGKTFRGLRPLIATALADGWQAVILDDSGVDFKPFLDHPNAHLVHCEAEQVIGYLQAMYTLVQARKQELFQAGEHLWREYGAGPQILGVIDEFSNLADRLETQADREDLWRWARMVASEGRKAGVHLAIALQDPTYRSMDLRIRRNMTPVVFKVQDRAASQVVLNQPGAEALPAKQFIAQLSGAGLVRGVGFGPGDEELAGWLAQRPVAQLPAPDWLAHVAPVRAEREEDQEARILELHEDGRSMREIESQVYGYTGGKAHERVRQVVQSATTTTATGATGVVAAAAA